MPVEKITIEKFFEIRDNCVLIDSRSPGEYHHARIPAAVNIPLFNDEERKVVGTAYKKVGKQEAIKLGLEFFGPKMRMMVEEVQHKSKALNNFIAEDDKLPPIIVHCWRGGMRSAAVAWLMDLYGFKVYLIVGGYKAYRNWVIQQFEKKYTLKILGGYTGSGKTNILQQMKERRQAIIDLENLAQHKGSAFGGIGQPEQPSQEMFENLLAEELNKTGDDPVWLEDESQRIGKLHIPHSFWNYMRTCPLYFVDIPFDERLKFILQEYGHCQKEKMQIAIERIKKRLGPLETKMALTYLQENNLEECFEILLKYYDKHYKKGLTNRENLDVLLNKITCSFVDDNENTQKLLECSVAFT